MSYIKVVDQNTTIYPYSDSRLRKDNPGTSFPREITDTVRAAYGVYPVIESSPSYNSLTHTATPTGPVLTNGQWVRGWSYQEKPIADVRTALKAQADSEYETRMTGGIVYQGLPVQSSDRAVINIIGANRNPNASRKNVIGGQPVTISAGMIAGLESAITSYTDSLGERRYDLYTAINAAQSVGDLAAIDTSSGWPNRNF